MTKNEIKTFMELATYARERASRSLKRNDPVAWAYWIEVERWASQDWASVAMHRFPVLARTKVQEAREAAERGDYFGAAKLYSRAKWFVILGCNNGLVMNPQETNVNLDWLREIDARMGAVLLER